MQVPSPVATRFLNVPRSRSATLPPPPAAVPYWYQCVDLRLTGSTRGDSCVHGCAGARTAGRSARPSWAEEVGLEPRNHVGVREPVCPRYYIDRYVQYHRYEYEWLKRRPRYIVCSTVRKTFWWKTRRRDGMEKRKASLG